MNKAYLHTIRANSCYPTFRAFITIATALSYIVAALVVIGGVYAGQIAGLLVGVAIALVIVLVAKAGQEVSLMIADIADATIDSAGQVRESRQDLGARTNDSGEKRDHAAHIASSVSPEVAELMAKYGIAYDGRRYRYTTCRFDSPGEAIRYAQSVAKPDC